MSYDKRKGDKLREEITNRMRQIAFFFETTLGYPHEAFFKEIHNAFHGKELGLQILFIDNFRKRYPKHCDPLPHWEDL